MMPSTDEALDNLHRLYRLPLRVRDSLYCSGPDDSQKASSPKPNATSLMSHVAREGIPPRHKRRPDSLDLPLNHSMRLRSPTESSMSTLSSVPDSATIGSLSTVATPLSCSYASDLHHDLFAGSRPVSRVLHRHQASIGTCSTFVNDEDDVPVIAKYADFRETIRRFEAQSLNTDPSHEHEGPPESPTTEAPLDREDSLSERRLTFYEESPPCETPPPVSKWEEDSTSSESISSDSASSDDCSEEEADLIVDYALQLAYGVDRSDTTVQLTESRIAVQKFVRELGQIIWNPKADSQFTSAPISGSPSNSSTPQTTGNGDSQRGGKRKKPAANGGSGQGGPNEDDEAEEDCGDGGGYLPAKRTRPNPKEEENLRLSCPFRKRNPQRFNVRDHHSCAMTFFPKMAELRQHIVKQHKRDDPSAFVCDRCNRDFATRKELRDHQRLPRELICEISDHDPESGIDGPTSNKLLSRKRASGVTPDVQWREIWNILFPDDDDAFIPSYSFTPVIEHFELSSSYLAAFNFLQNSLRDKMSNPATLDTLAEKFHQCFIETVERCTSEAQTMPYANRSNKRGEQLAAAAATAAAAIQPKTTKDVLPRPDSGVVMTDSGSDESGSTRGGSFIHHDSTVMARGGYRGSNQSLSRGLARAQTSSAVFDPSFTVAPVSTPTPMTVSSGSIAPSDITAWNQGAMFANQTMTENYGVHPAELTLHDMNTWHPQPFGESNVDPRGMPDGLNNFF